tara:strand:- start:537 stop:644 length:108 start_codon:yes stop_codon:yes gene_type:complete
MSVVTVSLAAAVVAGFALGVIVTCVVLLLAMAVWG